MLKLYGLNIEIQRIALKKYRCNDTTIFVNCDIYRMKYPLRLRIALVLTALSILLLGFSLPVEERNRAHEEDWGFFAHKRINRLAVLTLPPEMMVFFKKHIDYITDHAVDPDMRRYASRYEGIRHFIDMDNYGVAPFDTLPRQWTEALMAFTDLFVVDEKGDTLLIYGPGAGFKPDKYWSKAMLRDYKALFLEQVMPQVFSETQVIQGDSIYAFGRKHGYGALTGPPGRIQSAFFREKFTEHGILPWNLQQFQRRLTEAFRRKDARSILRLSAEIGHYIGDAHVPLHTTSNYNGQKTGQHGIHGFWESRIPELFADENYDYFVGKPAYIANTADWFWESVLESNSMVDSVLTLERSLKISFPADRQQCPDMRQGIMIMAPCRDFAAAYQQLLNGMVERRMRTTIRAVGSAWYTAWVDAGQPDLKNMDLTPSNEEEKKEEAEIQKMFQSGKIQGRPEDH